MRITVTAIAIVLVASMGTVGCQKKVKSGKYCSNEEPSHCFLVDKENGEFELLIDGKSVWKEHASEHLYSLDFYPKGEETGIYNDKPCKLYFDQDDPTKGQIEVYGRFPHHTFSKK